MTSGRFQVTYFASPTSSEQLQPSFSPTPNSAFTLPTLPNLGSATTSTIR